MILSVIALSLGHLFWAWWLVYEYERYTGKRTVRRWWEREL